MTSPSRRWLASPVLHFLVAGGVLFALALAFDVGGAPPEREAGGARDAGPGAATGGRGDDESRTIRVDRDALLAFVQARTRTASVAETEQVFEAATPEVRRDWLERYVREEALVREARALGLDRDDELVRRRLVQQMEFLVEGTDPTALAIADAELEAAYRERAETFREPPTVRFAHVFVRVEAGQENAAEGKARDLLEQLERDQIGFDGALALGDRFLYDRIYVDRTLDEVRSHFGDALAKNVAELPVDAETWRGPLPSEHGIHLVLLTARSESRLPALAEIEDALREELLREKRDQVLERGVEGVVAKYEIALEPGLGVP